MLTNQPDVKNLSLISYEHEKNLLLLYITCLRHLKLFLIHHYLYKNWNL